MREHINSILFLVVIAGILYVFSPESRLISTDNPSAQSGSLKIDIKERSLADPRQADLRAKVGQVAVLTVTTDEDGRIVLQGSGRDIFNPIFKGGVNTVTVPTDRPGSYRISFYPGASPLDLTGSQPQGVLIGSIVVEN